MNIIKYPPQHQWPALLARPVMNLQEIEKIVAPVLQQVKYNGDHAVKDYTLQFDKVELAHLQVSREEIEEAYQPGQP
jgi:histidinol dehydrogenase